MRTDLWLYQSYLLRLWRESTDGEWRASLQNISTGQCRYFANLPQLHSFLEEATRQPFLVWVDGQPGSESEKMDLFLSNSNSKGGSIGKSETGEPVSSDPD